jgi:hypothetical protein
MEEQMKSHELIKRLESIDNNSTVKILIDDKEYDIVGTEYTDDNRIILKIDDEINKKLGLLRNALTGIMSVWFK